MMEPSQRQPMSMLGWNETAAVGILVIVARHLLAVEPSPLTPLTPDRLGQFVETHTFARLVAALEGSPSVPVRHDAQHLRRLLRAGQA